MLKSAFIIRKSSLNKAAEKGKIINAITIAIKVSRNNAVQKFFMLE